MQLKTEDCKYLEEAIMHGRQICCVCGDSIINTKAAHVFYTDGAIVVDAESKSTLIDTNSSGILEVFIGEACLKRVAQKNVETLNIKHFTITTTKPEEFIDKLGELCKKYSIRDRYSFTFK